MGTSRTPPPEPGNLPGNVGINKVYGDFCALNQQATGATEGAAESVAEASARFIAKYGGEALQAIRRSQELLEFVLGVGKLHGYRWVRQAEVWRQALIQVIGQIEDTNLAAENTPPPKEFAGIQTLKHCIREHTTLILHTQKLDGSRRDVEVEPYALKVVRGEPTLICYNVDHEHLEQLPLHRILYSRGEGIHFSPRYPSYIEGEDDVERVRQQVTEAHRNLEQLFG